MLCSVPWFCAECAFGCVFNLACFASLVYGVCILSLSRGHFFSAALSPYDPQIWHLCSAIHLVVNFCSLQVFVFLCEQTGRKSRQDLQISWITCSCVVYQVYHKAVTSSEAWPVCSRLSSHSPFPFFVLNTKKQKPLLSASSSQSALVIFFPVRVVGALRRSTLGQCFVNCSYPENQSNRGGHAGSVRGRSSTICIMLPESRGCVCAWSCMSYGLVDHLMGFGPSAPLDHRSRNTVVDNPACQVEQMSIWANIHTLFCMTNRIFRCVVRHLQMYLHSQASLKA